MKNRLKRRGVQSLTRERHWIIARLWDFIFLLCPARVSPFALPHNGLIGLQHTRLTINRTRGRPLSLERAPPQLNVTIKPNYIRIKPSKNIFPRRAGARVSIGAAVVRSHRFPYRLRFILSSQKSISFIHSFRLHRAYQRKGYRLLEMEI